MIASKEVWNVAQKLERRYHNLSLPDGLLLYGNAYRNHLFKYLEVPYQDMQSKTLLEIGPADFPAIFFCNNIGSSVVIEPMPSEILQKLSSISNFTVFSYPAEDITTYPPVDETWLFNVLTHVMNPDLIIEKAKACSEVIRFFEPIDTVISADHPHSFTLQYYQDKFGDCVQYYPPNPTIQIFHTHECAYGVWVKK